MKNLYQTIKSEQLIDYMEKDKFAKNVFQKLYIPLLKTIQLSARITFSNSISFLTRQSRQDDVHRQVGGSGDPRVHFNHSPSQATAENRARSHSGGRTPIHHTAHKPGQYPHFHPTNKDK